MKFQPSSDELALIHTEQVGRSPVVDAVPIFDYKRKGPMKNKRMGNLMVVFFLLLSSTCSSDRSVFSMSVTRAGVDQRLRCQNQLRARKIFGWVGPPNTHNAGPSAPGTPLSSTDSSAGTTDMNAFPPMCSICT